MTSFLSSPTIIVANELAGSIEISIQLVTLSGPCNYCSTDSPKLRVFGNYKPACRNCYCQCVADGVKGSLRRMSAVYENQRPNIIEKVGQIEAISPKFGCGKIGNMIIEEETVSANNE